MVHETFKRDNAAPLPAPDHGQTSRKARNMFHCLSRTERLIFEISNIFIDSHIAPALASRDIIPWNESKRNAPSHITSAQVPTFLFISTFFFSIFCWEIDRVMALLHILILLTLILVSNCIQSNVPEVVEDYLHFNGSSIDSHHFAVLGAVDTLELQARQATPYWYEQIPHRGISAFGPAGYQVYRNVKDYGAKGILMSDSMQLTTDMA
jgi:hypothetical protein